MKEQLKRISLAVPTLLLAFTTLAAVPVYASHGSDDSTTSVKSSNSGPGNLATASSGSNSNEVETETETEIHTTAVGTSDDSQTTELHTRGKALAAELKAKRASKQTDAQRQKVCEAHKQGLTNKFTVISNNADKIKTRIDDVYTKAQTFQTNKNLSSEDLTTLTATADAAKLTVETSIANLKTVTPSLDCNNTSVAGDVATFKTAAQQTRTDLKAYRDAVKHVVKALKDAAPKTTDSTDNSEGSN